VPLAYTERVEGSSPSPPTSFSQSGQLRGRYSDIRCILLPIGVVMTVGPL
jgi:hypothetical protein